MTAQAMAPLGACGRCRTPLEIGDLRCAVCGLAAPATSSAIPERAAAAVLRCERCGAAVTYAPEAQGARCGFCASVMRLEQPVDPIENAEALLPFRVDPGTAQGALGAWLRSLGWFRPGDLATSSTIAALRPLWWAAWIVDADALVSWTADSNAGSGRSDWAPHSGQTPMRFAAVLVSASRGLSLPECASIAQGYDLRTAAPEPVGPPGAFLERFDVQRSAARALVVDAVRSAAAYNLQRGIIPGSRFRHVKASLLLHGLSTRRMALPAYVLAYRYKDRLYRALVSGQDARVVTGSAPYSVWKIVALVGGILALVAAILAAVVAYVALSSSS